MKSERRHELQHNELAEWLANSAAAIKPYQNIIVTSVLVVLAIIAGYTIWSRVSETNSAAAWNAVTTALDSGDIPSLAQVVDDYPNSTAAQMAGLVLADQYLATGCNRLFTNKATAIDELNKAIKLYDAVRNDNRLPMLVERATYGLARAKESKGDADSIAQAEKLYAEVAENWPNGTFGHAATQQLANLERPTTKQFYDDFAKFDPKPAFSDTAEKPAFDESNLPDEDPQSKTETPAAKTEDAEPTATEADGPAPTDAGAEPESK